MALDQMTWRPAISATNADIYLKHKLIGPNGLTNCGADIFRLFEEICSNITYLMAIIRYTGLCIILCRVKIITDDSLAANADNVSGSASAGYDIDLRSRNIPGPALQVLTHTFIMFLLGEHGKTPNSKGLTRTGSI